MLFCIYPGLLEDVILSEYAPTVSPKCFTGPKFGLETSSIQFRLPVETNGCRRVFGIFTRSSVCGQTEWVTRRLSHPDHP